MLVNAFLAPKTLKGFVPTTVLDTLGLAVHHRARGRWPRNLVGLGFGLGIHLYLGGFVGQSLQFGTAFYVGPQRRDTLRQPLRDVATVRDRGAAFPEIGKRNNLDPRAWVLLGQNPYDRLSVILAGAVMVGQDNNVLASERTPIAFGR